MQGEESRRQSCPFDPCHYIYLEFWIEEEVQVLVCPRGYTLLSSVSLLHFITFVLLFELVELVTRILYLYHGFLFCFYAYSS